MPLTGMVRVPVRARMRVVRVLAAGALAIALLLAPGAARAAESDWLELRRLNIAHQGGEDEAPSNTMYAYERALRLGADMLEVDIHTTADGRLVVLHDSTVDRTTNGSGIVYDMTLRQVRALDAAHELVPGEGTVTDRPARDYPFRGVRTGERTPPPGFGRRDFRIPTLGEVMRAHPMVPINIEIKGASDADIASYVQNAEALAAFLNRLGRTRGIIVASFNDEALRRFHELAPRIDLAPATAAVAAYKLADVSPPEGTVAFQVPTEFQGVTVADPPFVERAHSDGYAVHVWTINDPDEMRELLGWGVDGIMTAEPTRLERVLCRGGVGRPERPRSIPGSHCNRRASIACDVRPVRAVLEQRRLRVLLRRRDGFSGRCAGTVAAGSDRSGSRVRGRFNFGWHPPADGGAEERTVGMRLSDSARRSLRREELALIDARPYGAFVERERVRLARGPS